MPPSRKIKGGIKLWFIDSTNKTFRTINSQTLFISGQLYAMKASMISIYIVPTSSVNADTVALIPDCNRIWQYLPQTTILGSHLKSKLYFAEIYNFNLQFIYNCLVFVIDFYVSFSLTLQLFFKRWQLIVVRILSTHRYSHCLFICTPVKQSRFV